MPRASRHAQRPIVSIRAPVRERMRASVSGVPCVEFQSALPCGSESVVGNWSINFDQFQSALPCGSEYDSLQIFTQLPQFQSALPCGSEYGMAILTTGPGAGFNPRSRAGANKGCRDGVAGGSVVSIRAPVRERIVDRRRVHARVSMFQSALPCGSESGLCAVNQAPSRFQSALPCGSE